MARKHNVKKTNSRSNYKQRLADRGLGKTPRMRWTGLTTAQIEHEFSKLPHYKWQLITKDENGRPITPYQRRILVVH